MRLLAIISKLFRVTTHHHGPKQQQKHYLFSLLFPPANFKFLNKFPETYLGFHYSPNRECLDGTAKFPRDKRRQHKYKNLAFTHGDCN